VTETKQLMTLDYEVWLRFLSARICGGVAKG